MRRREVHNGDMTGMAKDVMEAKARAAEAHAGLGAEMEAKVAAMHVAAGARLRLMFGGKGATKKGRFAAVMLGVEEGLALGLVSEEEAAALRLLGGHFEHGDSHEHRAKMAAADEAALRKHGKL